jgi:ABC-2 type transport system ATP-binding protein
LGSPPILTVENLVKDYGALRAVNGVTFEVEEGETFGLLGPNGAGKSTTLGMMVGYLSPTSGTITVNGQPDPTRPEVRRKIGIAPQATALYLELTGEENVHFFGALHGMSGAELAQEVKDALELVELWDRRKDRARTYSGGMLRRLNLAAAMVHRPKIILLDEPTVGVDPQSRNHLLENIAKLKKEGLTVLYTTHYMEEAQRLCDRVAIMDQGKILALDTVPQLLAKHGGANQIEIELEEGFEPPQIEGATRDGQKLLLEAEHPPTQITKIVSMGIPLTAIRIHTPSLESVFLKLTGKRLRDE